MLYTTDDSLEKHRPLKFKAQIDMAKVHQVTGEMLESDVSKIHQSVVDPLWLSSGWDKDKNATVIKQGDYVLFDYRVVKLALKDNSDVNNDADWSLVEQTYILSLAAEYLGLYNYYKYLGESAGKDTGYEKWMKYFYTQYRSELAQAYMLIDFPLTIDKITLEVSW